MQRIARAIRAPIIGSIDHINQLDKKYALGYCAKFYVKYYNMDPNGNKGRRTPLMFFDKCPSGRHSTILLRGDIKTNLLKVKNVIRSSLHTLYHINLEKALLNNVNSTVPKKQSLSFYELVRNENIEHGFLSTSPYIAHNGWRRENFMNRLYDIYINKGAGMNEQEIWDSLMVNKKQNIKIQNGNISQSSYYQGHVYPQTNPSSADLSTFLVNHCRVANNRKQCVSQD